MAKNSVDPVVAEKPAEVAPEPVKEAEPAVVKEPGIILTLVTEFPLTCSSTGIKFTQGVPVEVPAISNWMQAQIDAKLITVSK